MAVLKTRCPECNAGLKSPTGFAVGQTVCCPKCETYFAVEEPEEEAEEPKKAPVTKGKPPAAKKTVRAVAERDDDEDDEDDDAPKKTKKKKKKRRDDDDDEDGGRSYKNSPVRFVILGILIVIMLVLGYFLYEKRKKEREDAGGSSSASGGGASADPNPPNPGPRPAPGPGPRPPVGKQPNPGPAGGGFAGAGLPNVAGFGGGGPALPPDEFKRRTDSFKAQLIGTWVADLGGGATEEITYTASGTFTAKLSGPAAATFSGKYTIVGLVGNNPYTGLKLRIEGGGTTRAVTAIFDGDDIEHTSLQPGVTGVFRKKS